MAFLFKSKKNQGAQGPAAAAAAAAKPETQPPVNGTAGSLSSLQNANGKAASNDKQGNPQSSTPQSSVNNSVNSLAGVNAASNNTPSPEQTVRRANTGDVPTTGPTSDLAMRNAPTAPPPAVSSSTNASLYPWSQRRLMYTSSLPSPFPRYGAAVNSVASKEGDIYLMGGLINSSTVKGDLWMVEAGSANMNCYPIAPTQEGPGPRVGHASLLVGNAFIVYGGDTKMEEGDELDETLYLLNTSTRQWSRAVPAGPRPAGRYGHSLNILGSKIYVFGGQVEGYFMNDLVAFDLNQLQLTTNRWEMLIQNSDNGGPPVGQIPPARTNHSVVTYNEKLYLFGGTNGFQWFNDVWCYDPIPNTWHQLDCIGYIPAPREGHAAALVDDVMYIFGGRTEEGSDLGDLAAFRISSRRWYTFQNMGPSPSPRSGHSMTAHGKQIVVLAGEPSSATREAQDLAIAYFLDTSKIRYPNDAQIQQTPSGERVQGMRRPSGGEKGGMGANRGLNSREGPSSIPEPKRLAGGRESMMSPPNGYRGTTAPGVNGNDSNGVAPGSAQAPGTGTKLPRASIAQAPPGPPPQQQLPAPRVNGAVQTPATQKPKPAAKTSVDNTARSASRNANTDSATSARERALSPQPSESPVANGRRTPNGTATASTRSSTRKTSDDISSIGGSLRSAKTRQNRGQNSLDSITESALKNANAGSPTVSRQTSGALRNSSQGIIPNEAMIKELEAEKNKNAWLVQELELARKSGYMPSPASSPMIDQRAPESFGEQDRPLVEALLAMRAELANVQGSIDKQAVVAAKQIAEVEKQRDAAVSEAVYAKAKLAAHGGGNSQSATPQPDQDVRDISDMSSDRSTDIGRRLASALALQKELKNKGDLLVAELEAEKRSRQLAEDTANGAQQRITELETYKQTNSSEVESLKVELHELQKSARDDATRCAEAVAALALLEVDKRELTARYEEAIGNSRDHSETFDSLREAVHASQDMKNMLERKLDEERTERLSVEDRLRKLMAEHEERTAELEGATRRLRDAEELAESHAEEARTHRMAVLSGLDKVAARDITTFDNANDERVAALKTQVEAANVLVKKYQEAADTASEKLRSAEERIAGLEAYQEQASREGLTIRKQLQVAMRETQGLQAANSEMKHALANQQLETNAMYVQHNTLKDLLGERGISPSGAARASAKRLSSPLSVLSAADPSQLKELEQQLASAHQAHQETKQNYETREQQAEAQFREKLSQLENDYQSAVHYVKGTEKMLKRMKDELQKYKSENSRMKTSLDELEAQTSAKSLETAAPAQWESEKSSLHEKIEVLQGELKKNSEQLEKQLNETREELSKAHQERDVHLKNHEESQRQLAESFEQARTDLTQLQKENSLLERRALDAEQKVSLLLDQVETSVDSYRRQSRLPDSNNNGRSHSRTTSVADSVADSVTSGDSDYTVQGNNDNRNSYALDSLASELETLRTHWETTNKNYRLSNAFDFEKERGDGENEVSLSSNLADWRKRLDIEEEETRHRKGSADSGTLGRNESLRRDSPSRDQSHASASGTETKEIKENKDNVI